MISEEIAQYIKRGYFFVLVASSVIWYLQEGRYYWWHPLWYLILVIPITAFLYSFIMAFCSLTGHTEDKEESEQSQ